MIEATRLRAARCLPRRHDGKPGCRDGLTTRRENASDLLHARFRIPAQPTSRGQDLPNQGQCLAPHLHVVRQQRGERSYGSLRIDQQHEKLLAYQRLKLG